MIFPKKAVYTCKRPFFLNFFRKILSKNFIESFTKMKKTRLTLLLLLQICILQAQTYQPGKLASNNFYEIVPFEWVKDKIIIPVQINDHTYRFIFDTGAVLFISSKVQKECGLDKKGSANISDATANKQRNDLFTIPEVKINNISFTNAKAVKSDFFDIYPANCFEVDGFIGSDLLTNIVVQIDLAKRQLILTDQPERLSLLPENAIKMNVDKTQGPPHIMINLSGGIREKVLFDSGADDFFTLNQARFQKLSKKNKIKGNNVISVFGSFSMSASGVIPPPSEKYMIRFPELNIGNYSIKNIITDFTNPAGSRIGSHLLRYGTVTLDYPGRKFYFQPNENNIEFKSEPEFGFRARPTGEQLVVSGIFRGSDAEQAGLKVGHAILKIDEEDFFNIKPADCHSFINGYNWQQRQQITVTFLNDESVQQTVVLKKISF